MAGLPSSLDTALTEAERASYGIPDDLKAQFKKQEEQLAQRKKENEQPIEMPALPKNIGKAPGNIPFQSYFVASSQRYGVPINVLMALAEQESRFNPTALGSQTKWGRAKGLMQYLDSTAAGMGINPYNPAQSIDAAARQLRERLDKGYSMIDAVREHFAGPDRKQWGPKTAAYGNEVMARAARLQGFTPSGEPAAAPQGATAQQPGTVEKLNAKEPGRYRALSEAEMQRMQEAQAQGFDSFVPFAGAKPIKIQPANDIKISQPKADQSMLSRFGNALGSGYDNMTRSMSNAVWLVKGGDTSDVAGNIFDNFKQQQEAQANRTPGQKRLDQAIDNVDKGEGFLDTLSRGWDAVKVAAQEPGAVFLGAAESLPNMAPSVVGAVGGAGAGAGVGAGAGALAGGVGAAPGAVAGAIWGGRIGFAAGTTAVEAGAELEHMVIDRLQKNKQPVTQANIKKLLDDPNFRAEAQKQGAAKGLTLAAVDALTMGAAGRVLSAPARQAEKKAVRTIIKDTGVDEKAARSLLASPAGRAALEKASPGTLKKATAHVGAFGVELLGEPVSEAVSQAVARGSVDWSDVTGELIYGAGQAAAGTVGAKTIEAGKSAYDRMRSGGAGTVNETAPAAEAAQQAAADLPVQDVIPAQPQAEPVRKGPIERALEGNEDNLRAQIDAELAEVNGQQPAAENTETNATLAPDADLWLGEPGTVAQISPKEDPESVYTVTVEGYQNGEVFARDRDGTPMQFGQNDVNVTQVQAPTVENTPAPELTTFEQPTTEQAKPEPVKTEKIKIEQPKEQPAPKQPEQVKQPERSLADMDEQELRDRLKYLAQQAKTNNGWNKRLMEERRKVEAEINKKQPSASDYIDGSTRWTNMTPDERMAAAEKAGIDAGTVKDLSNQNWESIDIPTMNKLALALKEPKEAKAPEVKQPEAVAEQSAEPSDFKALLLDAHVNNPAKKAQIIANEIKASGRTRGQVFAEVSRIIDDYNANQSQAAVKAAPAVAAAPVEAPVQAEAAPVATETATDERGPLLGADGNPKWFMSQDKAQAHIEKKKLTGQYEVKKVNNRRYEIHPTEAEAQATAPSNAAPSVAETATEQPATTTEAKQDNAADPIEQWRNDMNEALAKADESNPLYRKLKASAKNGLKSENDRAVALRQAREIEKNEQPASKSQPSDFIQVVSIGDKKAPTAEQIVEKAAEPKAEADQFAGNKLFTADKVAAARARLNSKLGQLNSGIDPEVLIDGMTIAGAYIESGVRKFSDYAKAMVEDLGDGVKPYLLSFWEGARNYPGLDTTGMTSVEDSAKEHAALLKPEDVQTEAVGQIAEKPKARTKKTGAKGDMVLTQDWGVEHINGYGESYDREIGNDTKDAFLKETRNYLNAVADALRAYGFEPHLDRKGKAEKPVSVNESGMAGSGDVTLTMHNPDNGNNVYITIGDTSLRGVVPMTPSGIAIMYRVSQGGDRYATRGGNTWAPVDLSANDLATLVNSRVRPVAKTEETQNARTVQSEELSGGNQDRAQENATTGNRDSEPVATGVAEESARTDRSEPVSTSTEGAGRSGARGVQQREQPSPGTARDRGNVRSETGSADAVADPATAETSPKPEIDQPADFDLKNEDIGTGGLTKKYKDNVAAIRILKAMANEGRVATPEERKAIARYVGWGALKGVFDKANKQWAKEYAELKELLTDAEYKAARASTLNAHYTSPTVVGGIFKALEQMGFTTGRVLEPSVGTGNFFGLMPAAMRKKSQLHGVELDPLTSQIAAALYPSAKIAKATGFQDFQVPAEYFDLAIGNPPFGSEPIVDSDRSPYSGSSIHNYFFAKSIDKLRPGGLLTMVVSHNFLDASNETTRRWISERADLVGAARLPRTAFKENAGTDVVTDILVFRKRGAEDPAGDASWVKTGSQKLVDPKTGNEVEHRVSSYFVDNPDKVLGTPSAAGSMYRAAEYTVEPNGDLEKQLTDWAGSLPQNLYQPIERTHEPEAADVSVPDGVKVGSYFVGEDGAVRMRGPDSMGNRTASEWTAPNAKAAERMKGMIGLRDALREQMRLEKSPDATEKQIEDNRAELNRLYDDFKKQYGFLNDQTNRRIFLDDTESALLLALEFDYDKGVSKAVAEREDIEPRAPSATKADIFNRRVMFPPADNIKVSNANDALLASLNYKARLDLPYMASLYDKPEAEIISELGDVVFNDPLNGYVMADEYLSGDVKTKLAEAEEAAKDNPEFKRNVEALKKVIPADKLPSEIHAAMGASFIPAELFEQFAKEVTGADHKVVYIKATGQWVIDPRGATNDSLNVGKWGISKMPATAIFARTMAGQGVVVTETIKIPGGGTETRVLEKETEAAREKQAAMKAEWQRWLWSDPDRADRVASIYNEKMNRIVVRKYDGSHLTFPGMSPAMELLPHQKNAVWRALQSRQVLFDHVVGAGKTFEVVALFMEMRRLGIARKPFIAVPNHLTLQWRSEFSRLYPAANVLAATPDDFSKGNREKFFSKIVTGDWDAVIVGHSSLKKIALPPETEKAVLEEQIHEIADAIEDMKRARGDRNIIRDMEGIKARLEARMKQRIQNLGERDKVVTFDELGVDAFAIDELHEFKNLFYNSTMERVPGMGNPSGSDKAFDLFVKLQWMFNTFGDKAPIAGATGTPVSNSLVEMFNMQRLLQYPMLKREGLHVFDAWAKQFGSVESLYEVAPSGTGYRQSSRFAKFKNLPALMSHYQTFADTVTLDDLKAQEEARGKSFPVPKVAGGRPQNIVAKRSPDVASFMGTPELDIRNDQVQFGFNIAAGDEFAITPSKEGDFYHVQVLEPQENGEAVPHMLGTAKTEEDARLMLVEQALSPKIMVDPKSILGQFANLKQLNKATKGKVNALSLTGQANKAGLDYRLIDPTAPDFPGSKINLAVDRMLATYKKWDKDKGTQLIFCDLSVPQSARSGFGAKERRVYVREDGQLTHKKGTMHTVEGYEDLPFFAVKEGKDKTFAIYDAATGLRVYSGLPSKQVAVEWAKQTLSDDAERQKWIDARDALGDIEQDAIDDYNNANEINTEESEAISLADIAGASGAAGFSVYDDIKAKLIAKGIPEREIAFIHDYSTPVAKDKLFKAVNAGTIRFLLGSTPKMGAGTNVQKRLVGLHHIDAPWRPSDLEQREGRIIRRGNTLYERDPQGFEVEIYRYATEQTYDTRRWQILEHKSRGIEQLRNYDGSINEIDDIEGEAANAADMKAAASGDPLILEETQLRNDVRRLESLQAAHADSTQMLFRRARDNQRFAEEYGPRTLEQYKELQAAADKHPVKKDQFAGLTVNGKTITDREEAIKAIQKDLVRTFAAGGEASFTYRGIEFTLDSVLGYVELNSPTGRLDSFDPSKDNIPSAAGFLTRFANYISRIPGHIESLTAEIAEAKVTAGELRELANKPFAQADELTNAREAHKRVQRRLIAKGPDIPAAQKPMLETAMERQKEALRRVGLGGALEEFAGSRLNSRGQVASTGTTADQVRNALSDRFGAKLVAKLESDGTLSILDTYDEPGVEGFTQGGKVTLVADALTTENIVPVFLHELGGHVGMQGVMKPEAYQNLMDQFNRLVAAQDPIALEAKRLAEREADPDTQQAEYLPYLVTVAAREQRKKPGILTLINRIVAAVKAWAVDKLGVNINLNANDVLALAERMVSTVSDDVVMPKTDKPLFSRKDEDLAPVSSEEYASGLNKWSDALKNLPSDTLTNAMQKGLGLVPLRPMLNELAKDIPAARTYLRIKDKMDAMRNEWHAKTDAVAQNWLKYRIKNREENRDLMDLMHEATLAQVDPSKQFESILTPRERMALENLSPGNPNRKALEDKAEKDAQRKESYKKLKDRYDALSPEAKSIFGQVRDAYSDMADAFDKTLLNNMEKAINVRISKAEREYNREMERIKDEGLQGEERDNAIAAAERRLKNAKTKIAWNRKARMTQLRQQFETQRLAGPYFPLARFGQFFVTVRDAKTGEVVSFSRFEDARDQRRFAEDMSKDKNYTVERGALTEASAARKAVDPNFVADVEDILADLPNAEQVKDEVWQRYLESLPDMSIRKARIHRKGRAGYTADAVRAFGHHLFHGSHQLARMAHSMDLEDALDQARDEARETKDPTRSSLIVNEMEKRHQFVMSPTGGQLATWASSFAFLWYLAGSPKAAIMNLFQTPVMGVPILGAYAGGLNGVARAGKELTRALVDFTAGKGYAGRSTRLSDEERDAMQKGYDTGIIEKTQGHELAGVAESGVEYNAFRERAMKIVSWGFHHTERLNREVTFLAAYRMARAKGEGHEQAITTAGDLTWKTHFDYSNTSRPRLMHNDTMKILLVFRNFQINMLFRLFRDVHQAVTGETKEVRREAFTQLAGITGMMMLNAGVTGTWLFGIAMLMAGMFMDDGEDPEEELKKAMVNVLGPRLAGVALHGVPGYVSGTSLSESVGMPDLWFRSPDSEKEADEAVQYWLEQLMGAVPAIAMQAARGIKYMKQGEEYRGIETMMPKMLKDPMKAYRYATDGAKNMRGDTVTDVTFSDVVKQALGFTPARIAEQYKTNNASYNKQQAILKERKQLMDTFYKADKKGNDEEIDKLMEKIAKYNEKYPDQAITGRSLIQSRKTRDRGADKAVGGMRYNSKLRDRLLEEQSPSIYGE